MSDERKPYLALERELGLLLARSRAQGRELAAQVHPDLDALSYATLARIEQTAPVRASELAEYFGVDKAAVSRQISRLEELELIERTPDPADARARALDLTAQGRSRLQAVRLARRDRFRSLVSTWPRTDVAELARLLGELNRLL